MVHGALESALERKQIDLYIVPEQRKRRMVRQPNIAHPHADTNYVMISPRASATYNSGQRSLKKNMAHGHIVSRQAITWDCAGR